MLLPAFMLHLAMATAEQGQAVQLATTDTVVRLQADENAPRFLDIALPGGPVFKNRGQETPIDHVEVHGSTKHLQWRLQPDKSSFDPQRTELVYESVDPKLRLSWEWRIRAGAGPIEHAIRIQNLSNSEVWLPLQDSFRYNFAVPRAETAKFLWVEKGASSPSDLGTHFGPLGQQMQWTGTSSTYAHPPKGAQREFIPYLLVERGDDSGWYMGIEFSGRTRIGIRRNGDSIAGEAGLNPNPGVYRTRLAAGEIFETPTIFIGSFKGGPDGAANELRRWIREVFNNPVTLKNPAYPMLVSNSWGSGMAINEGQAQSMIRDASGLGLEMFHLDAGWFRALGDWVPNSEKFPHGIGSVADFAHKMGLKFGLWTDWTQAGESMANDPKLHDWLTVNPPAKWKPAEFKGITMDLGFPPVREWASRTVARIISDYHLDMLEHDGYLVAQGCVRSDHPHTPMPPANARYFKDEDYSWVEGENSTDVSYFAVRAYYQVQAEMRKQYPGLLFEICNDGGRMVDFGSAAHGDYFSITDAYDPVSNRKAFYDASYVLPPAMMETYVQKWPTPHIENFRYMLRSGLMGWFSLMQDSNTWTAEQHQAAKSEFTIYKTRLRPLIRAADVYHISDRADGVHWDGMEYFDAVTRRGVLFAFHGSSAEEVRHVFRLKGLSDNANYRLTFQDHSSPDFTATGNKLMREGVELKNKLPNSSELVFIQLETKPS